MKKIQLIAIAALCAWAARAQTGADAAANSAKQQQTQIQSTSVYFDMTGRHAVYRGNVRVENPQMKLSCALLTVDLPPDDGHPNHIVAETNVVIDFADEKGQMRHATSDKAVYLYEVKNGATNETVVLTGNAIVKIPQGRITGEPIIWNRANDSFYATNEQMLIDLPNLGGMKAGTNSPPK
jgi:lipopolysaccharide transport protein LptA